MAVFRWKGGSVAADQGRVLVASDWTDLTTGTSGVTAPATGDTLDIVGVANNGISKLGALYIFPVGGGYTQVLAYAPQSPSTLQNDPNAVVGYTLQGQVLNVIGFQGPVSLWLENSHLADETINVAGTALVSSYMNSTISGAINVGALGAAGFLQIEPIPEDTALIGPKGAIPVTTLSATVTIGAASTFNVEAPNATCGIVNNGAIDVAPGGTLDIDDVDDPKAVADAANPAEVDFTFNNTLILDNTGTISIQGSAGHITRAAIIADTLGSGSIAVDGNGAPASATSLVVDGYMTGQNISVDDATIRFDDATTAIGTPGSAGFNITGGSFTFAGTGGTLILDQATLTTLTLVNGQAVQKDDHRRPFTTPIAGFGQGDTIVLKGDYLGGLGLTYAAVYTAATGVLQIQSVDGAGAKPEIYAQLNLVGAYTAQSFVLTGNSATDDLTLTCTTPASAAPAISDLARHGFIAAATPAPAGHAWMTDVLRSLGAPDWPALHADLGGLIAQPDVAHGSGYAPPLGLTSLGADDHHTHALFGHFRD